MKIALNSYHPAVAVLPFAAAIGFSMLSFHPVYSAISLFCSITLALKLNGLKALRLTLRFCLPIFILTVLINTAFNQNGATVMFHIGDWVIVWEGFIYGLCSASALCSVLLWFSCYSAVIDSEKFLFLSNRFSPTAALLVSMTLGQASQMSKKMKEINDAQTGIYGEEHKKFAKKLRLAMLKISVLLSWSMEDSIQTADSMHSRGYGTGKMTRMNPYIFGKKDAMLLTASVALICICIASVISGNASFRFYPVTQAVQVDALSIAGYCVYFVMLSLPLLVEIKEAVQWHFYMSGI
jgi:energy-coupling factor transport system permease protein